MYGFVSYPTATGFGLTSCFLFDILILGTVIFAFGLPLYHYTEFMWHMQKDGIIEIIQVHIDPLVITFMF